MRHQIEAAFRQVAQQVLNNRQDLKLGQVTSADPASHAVKAVVQPEGKETGWIPFGCVVFGPGAGVFALPVKDSQVALDHEQADPEAGVAQHSICDNNFTPPAGFQAGEFWVVLANGVTLKLTNDGKVTVIDKAGSEIVMNGDGTGAATFASGLTVNADVTVNGNLHSTKTITGDTDVVTGSISLGKHKHGGVQTGSGVSAGPQ